MGTRCRRVLKLKGGAKGETVLIHAVCHRMIHKTPSEGQPAQEFATVDASRAHEGLRRFWD